MEDNQAIVTARPYNPDTDAGFIFSTWRKGLYYGHVNKDKLPNAFNFMRYQTEKIKKILPTAEVRIACIKDAPEVILGYAVFTGDLNLEWVFVKLEFRNKRIATFLTVNMKSAGPDLTKVGYEIAKQKNIIIKESTDETKQIEISDP